MKSLKLIISVICVTIAIIICAAMVHFSNENFVEDVFLGSNIEEGVDDYLISQGYVTPSEKSKGVWLTEGKDTSFDKGSESLSRTVKRLKKTVFDVVIVRSKYFAFDEKKAGYEKSFDNLKNIASLLKEQNKKLYVEMDLSHDSSTFKSVASLCDGIVLKADKDMSVEKLNMKLMKIVHYINKGNKSTKTFIELSLDFDISKFNKKAVDGVFVFIDEQTDSSELNLLNLSLKMAGSELVCSLDTDKVSNPLFPLKAFYEAEGYESVTGFAFSSFSGIYSDKNGSFAAVERYIVDGIVPDIAFRKLNVTGYDGNEIVTENFTEEIELCGSNLFPVYMNGKKLELGEKGSARLSLELKEGENVFTFTQCGEKLVYKVKMNFTGDIISSVSPEETVSLLPGEEMQVMIIAYSAADITVKVGTEEYEAKCAKDAKTGYAAFTAKIKMPDTPQEVSSLGMISVMGSVGERTVQEKGAMIVCAEKQEVIRNQDESTTAIQLENYVKELIDDKYEYTTKPSVTLPLPESQAIPYSFTGNQMCIINVPYADTRPLIYNDETYTPSFSTLVQGTMDYVTAESSAYNKHDEEMVYFYELASGRKVKREDVQLVTASALGQNTLKVLSSQSENGTLRIHLQTSWKVPYAITHTPQNYFSAYGGKFNLSSFNADYIQIDFFHTASVEGAVDASGSNVVSSAAFAPSAKGDCLSLKMPLINKGKYYGISVEYNADGTMLITVHNNPKSLKGSVILLDPGHGGKDPGALGIGGKVKESDVNLAVAYATRDALRKRGATVYLTRKGNEYLSLDERKNIAASIKPDLFVAIHSNGSEKSSAIGTSVYYYKGFSQPLAKNIYNEMIKVFKNHLYSGQPDLYDDLADGARFYPFSVTRIEDCPSVLIETGYMTNDNECYKLTQSRTHTLFGKAIADGIEKTISGK